MKSRVLAVALAMGALGVGADSSFAQYDGVRERVGRAFRASGRVRECPHRIRWDGDDAIVYATRGPKGDVKRRFTLSTSNLVDIAGGEFEEVWKRHQREGAPKIPNRGGFIRPSGTGDLRSPDGRWTAFVRDHNLWLRTGRNEEFQLSFDGTEGNRYVDMMWSSDSKQLAAMREHREPQRQLTLVESRPSDSPYPRTHHRDYAKPGDGWFNRTPALFLPEERRQVHIDFTGWERQCEMFLDCWLPDSSSFTFTWIKRGFTAVRLGAVAATSGKMRVLAEERSDKFVFSQKIRHWWLGDGKRFLWKNRTRGWYHLDLVSVADGSRRALTSGEWNVREVLSIAERRGLVFFTANGFAAAKGEDPYHLHLLRLDLATGEVVDLTPENADHRVTLNPAATRFTDYFSRVDQPPRFVVRDLADGRILAELPKIEVGALDAPAFPKCESFCAKGRDGKTDIWGTIWRPLDFNPSNRYPVIEYIYAGPHDSFVPKGFPINPPRGMNLLADGFVVVQIDGMGTENRSREFHEVCWRNLKDAGFPDRIPWLKAAATTRPWMDLSRVGIYGYSAGGQSALGALLFHGDFYRAAVALAGCHDNRIDKLWWNEQWMGYPLGPWYAENSNVDNAYRLKGDLLLINGELDDNVDPVSTLQVVGALVKAKKNFEQLYLPGHNHNLGGEYIDTRILDFFNRKLK